MYRNAVNMLGQQVVLSISWQTDSTQDARSISKLLSSAIKYTRRFTTPRKNGRSFLIRKKLLLMRIPSIAFKNYERTVEGIPLRAEKVCFRDCFTVLIANPSFISARQRVSMKTKNFTDAPLTKKIVVLALSTSFVRWF